MDIQLLQWAGLLALAIVVLVKGADVLLRGATEIGKSLGLSSFIIGVVIVGVGTSLPEVASSLAAVLKEETTIVVANAVGSNITNILLVVGFVALLYGPIRVRKKLIQTELPIFFIATTHFLASVYDGQVDRLEALLLVGTFIAYLWYLLSDQESSNAGKWFARTKALKLSSVGFVVLGLAGLLIGAHYTVAMTINIATALSVPIGLVSILAIAIGTSLPELFASLKAAQQQKAELAIGGIFGSNAFNILLVVGLPGLLAPLEADAVVMELGLIVLLAASAIFFVNGLARQIMRWEGAMMLLFFGFFLAKLYDFI